MITILVTLITAVASGLLLSIISHHRIYDQFPLDRYLKTQHRLDVRQRK